MADSEENIMGTMSEGRLLFKMALPMIFSVLVSSLYNQEIPFCVRVQRACHVGLQFRRYDCCRAVRGNARRGDEEAANAFFTASVLLMIMLAAILWVLFALFHDAVFIFFQRV